MAVVGWIDTESPLLNTWADMPADEAVLTSYLKSAYNQCLAYLPHDELDQPVIPDPVPENFQLAQILQARALQRSAVTGSNNQMGSEFPVTVFPMDWTIKNLLRPRKIGRVL